MKGSNAKLTWFGIGALCTLLVALIVPSCAKKAKIERGGVAEAAIATYVAPGDVDE